MANFNISHLILDFLKKVVEPPTSDVIYNECSLQHELGFYLRSHCPGWRVDFERNAEFFGIPKADTVKHEIDLVVYPKGHPDGKRYAIELKCPLNGQYPETMYACVKDICFMEQLRQHGFTGTYCLTLADDKLFWTGDKETGIYAYFRSGKSITGDVAKPTGNKEGSVHINGSYSIGWKPCGNKWHYYLLTIH